MSRSVKDNICVLVALMRRWNINHVVVCPGSRNAPIVHTIAETDGFICHPVTDERSATFVAIGIADATGECVAVCCTSGSAVLNLAPGVAEAFYRNIPLLLITADRPKEWIGQMDGQTLRQSDVFGEHAKTFDIVDYSLTDATGLQSHWAAERDINEALSILTSDGGSPVHVNIQLNEPLFDFSDDALPAVRKIDWERCVLSDEAKAEWQSAKRPMFIIGQMHLAESSRFVDVLSSVASRYDIPVLAEHLSNYYGCNKVGRFDDILAWTENDELSDDALSSLEPDLVVYVGGHIVSKRVKKWLRKVRPVLWHVTEKNRVVDLMMSVRRMVKMTPSDLFSQLAAIDNTSSKTGFFAMWNGYVSRIGDSCGEMLSAFNVTRKAFDYINDEVVSGRRRWIVALANSSTVRTAQRCDVASGVEVVCNRGVNGIEGSLSEAVGCALASPDKNVLCIIGDLSFFYDMNALWNVNLPNNLTVIVVNNGCGSIFGTLKGLEKSKWQWPYVAAKHSTSVRGWAEAVGCRYVELTNIADLAFNGGEIIEAFVK